MPVAVLPAVQRCCLFGVWKNAPSDARSGSLDVSVACVPQATRAAVGSVVSGLAHVRAHERFLDCFVGWLRALASNGRRASFSEWALAFAASVPALVSCVAYPLCGILWLGRLVPPRHLSEVLADSKAARAVRFSRSFQRLLRRARACWSLGPGLRCERGFRVPLCC